MAKASLYNTFGSKDELVRAYLETRQASVAQRITRGTAAPPSGDLAPGEAGLAFPG